MNSYYHWFNLPRYLSFSEKYKTFECITCGDKIPLHYAPSRSPTTKCNHDPTVCNTNDCFRKDCNHKHQNECDPMPCLRKYVESCTRGRGWQNITCPHPGCESTLSARDVEEWAPPEAFRRCVSLCWCLLQFIRYYASGLLVEAGVRGSWIRCCDAVCSQGKPLRTLEGLYLIYGSELTELAYLYWPLQLQQAVAVTLSVKWAQFPLVLQRVWTWTDTSCRG